MIVQRDTEVWLDATVLPEEYEDAEFDLNANAMVFFGFLFGPPLKTIQQLETATATVIRRQEGTAVVRRVIT